MFVRLAVLIVASLLLGAQALGLSVVGIDDARDRIVSIDLSTLEQQSLLEGRAIRASAVTWSPDDSFAYLTTSEGLLIFDPVAQDVVGSIGLDAVERVYFDPFRSVAYVQACGGTKIVDTENHVVIGEGLLHSHQAWVFSSSGRWAYAGRGRVVGLDGPLVSDWHDCDGEGRAVAGANDHLILPCGEFLSVVDAAAGREVRRIPLNGRVQALSILPGGEAVMVVTNTGIARFALADFSLIEVSPLPEYISPHSGGQQVAFSKDGRLLYLRLSSGTTAYQTSDLSIAWTEQDGRDRFLSPRAVTQANTYPFSTAVWREADRSYYETTVAGLERWSTDDGLRQLVLRDYNFSGLAGALESDSVFAIAPGDRLLRRISSVTGEFDEFALDLGDGVQQMGEGAIDLAGDTLAIVAGRYSGNPDILAYEATDLTLLGFHEADYGESPLAGMPHMEIVSLGGSDVVAWSTRRRRLGFLNLVSGEIARFSQDPLPSADVSVVVADPVEGGVLVAYSQWQGDLGGLVPVVVQTTAFGEDREIWRGPLGYQASAMALAADGAGVFVAIEGAWSRRAAVVKISRVGEVLFDVSLASKTRGLVVGPDETWLIASQVDEPHLVVLDSRDGHLFGSVPNAPSLSAVQLVGNGSGALSAVGTLDAVTQVPELPIGSDVLLFADGLTYREENSYAIVRSSGGSRVYDADGAGGGMSAVGDVVYLATTGQVENRLRALDLASGTLVDSAIPTRLDYDGLAFAPDGTVLFATKRDYRAGQVLLSVVDMVSAEILHSVVIDGLWNPSSPTLSQDGRTLILQFAPIVLFHTRDSSVTELEVSAGSNVVPTRNGFLYYRHSDRGREIWRVEAAPGAEPELVVEFGEDHTYPELYASADGGSVLVVASKLCADEWKLVVLDAGGGVRLTFDPGAIWRGVWTSLDGARIFVPGEGEIRSFDAYGGVLLARIPVEGNVRDLAVGCVGDCPAGAPIEIATPWRDRGTVTPTPRRTPTRSATATPTGAETPEPPVQDWFEIAGVAGRPGDVVELAVMYRTTDYSRYWEGGLAHEVVLPEVVEVGRWVDGEPDCSGDYDGGDSTRVSAVLVQEGCAAGDCDRLSVAAVTDWWVEDESPMYRCRMRIRADAEPGEYPLTSVGLAVDGWLSPYVPEVVSASLTIVPATEEMPYQPGLQARPEPVPLIDRPVVFRGGRTEVAPGERTGFPFYLDANGVAQSGHFEALIEIPRGISPVRLDSGEIHCGPDATSAIAIDFEPATVDCAEPGCHGLRVSMQLETLAEHSWRDESLRVLQIAGRPLFGCDLDVAASDVPDGEHVLRIVRASLDDVPLETQDGAVDVLVPALTPAPAATPTATPTFALIPRRCVPIAPGLATVCVSDFEADAGEEVLVGVRFRSAGAGQAGLEFNIDGSGLLTFADSAGLVQASPECEINPQINREASAFSHVADGVAKALVLSFRDLSPIADDVEIAICRVVISDSLEPGFYQIRLTAAGGSDGQGNAVPLGTRSGQLRIRGVIPTATATVEPSPTHTALVPTATMTPTATRTPPTTAVRTSSDRRQEIAPLTPAFSGCQVAPLANPSLALLLLPLAILIAAWRRI